MEYMILIYGDESALSSASQAQLKAMYAEYGVYTQELMKAGVMRAGSELKPAATATTVRLRGGKVLSTDGPFAETEQTAPLGRAVIGGLAVATLATLTVLPSVFSILQSGQPTGSGSVEVRPLAPMNK